MLEKLKFGLKDDYNVWKMEKIMKYLPKIRDLSKKRF